MCHPRKALEVVVCGTNRAAVFEGQRGNMGVSRQISRGPCLSNQIFQNRPMPGARSHHAHILPAEPFVDKTNCPLRTQWTIEYSRTGAYPHERHQRHPRQSNGPGARERFFPPGSRWFVLGQILVEGINQKIGIDQDHLRCSSFVLIAVSSSCSAKCKALLISTSRLGTPMATGVNR